MPPPSHRVAAPPERALVLFDGDCRFCRAWAARWQVEFAGRLDVLPAQAVRARFPEIPAAALAQALHLVEPDGAVYSGAHAVLRARAFGRGRPGWAMRAYESGPRTAAHFELGYRIVARHRRIFSILMA